MAQKKISGKIWILSLLSLAGWSTAQAFSDNLPNTSVIEQKKTKKTWIRVSSKRCELLVFMHRGQSINGKFGTASDATLLARAGTIITVDNDQPFLHDGCLSLSCHKGSSILRTRHGIVKVPEGAAVLVSCVASQNTLRVSVLSSGKSNVSVSSKGIGKELEFREGEELVSGNIPTTGPQSFDLQQLKASNADIFVGNKTAGTDEPLHALGADGSMLRLSAPDTLFLLTGELFFLAPNAVTVQSNVADALVSRGSFVDVDADESELRVKAFNEPVYVSIARTVEPMEVKQSQELLLTAHEIGGSDLNPSDGIGRRRTQKIDLGKTLKAAESDFSMMSFLDQARHIEKIKHPETAEKKSLRAKFMKTAAAIQTMSSQYGPYQAVPWAARKRSEPRKLPTSI